MEHVAFLIEESGERIRCMLNPDSIVMRRLAGLRLRRSAGGLATGAALTDNPLLRTGGGVTELNLDLLFDVSLSGSSIVSEDVRDLTAPIWALAENAPAERGYGSPPVVRFVWGKTWNIGGAVKSVAERLERFTPEGVPRRSWMRLRMLRVNAPHRPRDPDAGTPAAASAERLLDPAAWPDLGDRDRALDIASRALSHETLGAGSDEDGQGPPTADRLDSLSDRYYGSPSLWRVIARFNDIANPLSLAPGSLLKIPTLDSLQEAR